MKKLSIISLLVLSALIINAQASSSGIKGPKISSGDNNRTESMLITLEQLKKFKSSGIVANWSEDKKVAIFKTYFLDASKKAKELNLQMGKLLEEQKNRNEYYKTINLSWSKWIDDKNSFKNVYLKGLESLKNSIELFNEKNKTIQSLSILSDENQREMNDLPMMADSYFKILFGVQMSTSDEMKLLNHFINVGHVYEKYREDIQIINYEIESLLNEFQMKSIQSQMKYEDKREYDFKTKGQRLPGNENVLINDKNEFTKIVNMLKTAEKNDFFINPVPKGT